MGWDEIVATKAQLNLNSTQCKKKKRQGVDAKDGTGGRARAKKSLPNAGDEQVNVSPNTSVPFLTSTLGRDLLRYLAIDDASRGLDVSRWLDGDALTT